MSSVPNDSQLTSPVVTESVDNGTDIPSQNSSEKVSVTMHIYYS